MSSKGTVAKKVSLVCKNLIHVIDNIFWNMGFKNETQAEKVILDVHIILIISITYIILWLDHLYRYYPVISLTRFISLISIMQITLIISLFVQVCVDLGIADHVWQAKRAGIAATVDAIGW